MNKNLYWLSGLVVALMLVSSVSAETSFSTTNANAVSGETSKSAGGGGTSNSQNPSLNSGAGSGVAVTGAKSASGGGSGVVSSPNGTCPDPYVLVNQNGQKACLKVNFLPPTSAGGGSGVASEAKKVIGEAGPAGAPRQDSAGNCPDPKLWTPGSNGECLKIQVPAIFLDGNQTKEVIFSSSASGGGGSISIQDSGPSQAGTSQTVEVAPSVGLKVFATAGGKLVSVEAEETGTKKFISTGSYEAKPDCDWYLSLCKQGADDQSCAKYAYNCEKPGTTITAETKETVKLDNGKVYLNDKEVKIMPDTASTKALEVLGGKYEKIELKDTGQPVPVYEISGTKMAKFLGLVKVQLTTKTEVDSATGELIKVKKPWWRFLAF